MSDQYRRTSQFISLFLESEGNPNLRRLSIYAMQHGFEFSRDTQVGENPERLMVHPATGESLLFRVHPKTGSVTWRHLDTGDYGSGDQGFRLMLGQTQKLYKKRGLR